MAPRRPIFRHDGAEFTVDVEPKPRKPKEDPMVTSVPPHVKDKAAPKADASGPGREGQLTINIPRETLRFHIRVAAYVAGSLAAVGLFFILVATVPWLVGIVGVYGFLHAMFSSILSDDDRYGY